LPLLEVDNLDTVFATGGGLVHAVEGVSFSIERGETLGVVGESGCGKSAAALSVMRLLPKPLGRIAGGRVLLEGRDLAALSEKEMRRIRGNRISMIFQEPMTSLNPVFTVRDQVMEPLFLHQGLSRSAAKAKAVDLLKAVGIPSAEARINEYPHQFSGGQRQRIMIAMALACNPDLLIADEPTTALDVTVQAQILDLINELKAEFGSSVMLITHSLGVVAETAQRVMVMYAAKVAEEAPASDLFRDPKHPYTKGLLASILSMDSPLGKSRRLPVIPGLIPSPLNLPKGCRFNDRCAERMEGCGLEEPPLFDLGGGRKVRCWLHGGGAGRHG
jgi:oligopeptide/dipeptide ABC transporter ATP-binding protein